MTRKIIFIQGGDEGGHEADKALVRSLQQNLGGEYEIIYPELASDELAPDYGWVRQIEQQILETSEEVVIVGHSFGASMVLKYLSEKIVPENVKAIFLIATPFWSGDEDWKAGLKLKDGFAGKLPADVPLFFYHCTDDEVAPIGHFNLYRQKLVRATYREIGTGGHQLNNDLAVVANDIRALIS